ncbi:ATP-binding protein [Oceanobacillus alkalisoli]|uniref:ATP-binding protein n=1 Tax=Oceanobacillus alkalisoli TaxID=2925113 RepID=UPI001EE4BD62|nr:sensor histidine kinase [Oceanobacillus alkalisoli]MCG5102177.1 sensor histidine kinase [Oceanobacillus alkalisoli]
MKKRIRLRTKILLLSSLLVCCSVFVSGITMLYSISASFEEEIGERAIAIARTVGQLDEIRSTVGKEGGEETIQPIAERIRLSTNVDYIVILDMNKKRYSHPSESFIGQVFEGGDERAAFSELEYISKAEGDLGFAIRAFVPIMDEEGITQVGVAVVGILAPNLKTLLKQYHRNLFFSLLGGLLIGLVGAWFLANNVKKQTYRLEPYEIARLFEERSTIMQTLDIGIIATDDRGKISFMNHLAEEYTDATDDTATLEQVFNKNWLSFQRVEEMHLTNKPINLGGTMYLLSVYPIFVKDDHVGSLLTLQNRSVAHQLGEELTGVKELVGALRAQNHEHMNKLHSIGGLIQLGKIDKALKLIVQETSDEENLVSFIRNHIKDYAVSGLILGKRSRAKELGVTFDIELQSFLEATVQGLSTGDIITIVGNLIDNAFEACDARDKKKVTCLIQGNESYFYFSVTDTGIGMTEDELGFIFDQGYSSKAKEGRGIGLTLVKDIVDLKKGTITITSEKYEGTTAEVVIKV